MRLEQTPAVCLAYLVHNLDDAAVRRRVDLFAAEGVSVEVGGFQRREQAAVGAVANRVVNFGRTADARLARRALTVLRHLLHPRAIRAVCSDASVIVARNLEMLLLASRVRSPGQRLIYECLDIHRLMLGSGTASTLMRWLEQRLLARTDLIVVSSPAFARDYFGRQQGRSEGVLLVENKLPGGGGNPARVRRALREHAPIVIGWFGMLRCRKTLAQLASLARLSQGAIEIRIAGIPSEAEFPAFERLLTGMPGVRYLGAYNAADLPELYASVDFVWAVDYFEEGRNSDWLLPNRLYEGLAHGVVPIALRRVETGRWLHRHGVGILVDDPVAELPVLFAALTSADRARLYSAVEALPDEVLYQTPKERRAIARAIAGTPHG